MRLTLVLLALSLTGSAWANKGPSYLWMAQTPSKAGEREITLWAATEPGELDSWGAQWIRSLPPTDGDMTDCMSRLPKPLRGGVFLVSERAPVKVPIESCVYEAMGHGRHVVMTVKGPAGAMLAVPGTTVVDPNIRAKAPPKAHPSSIEQAAALKALTKRSELFALYAKAARDEGWRRADVAGGKVLISVRSPSTELCYDFDRCKLAALLVYDPASKAVTYESLYSGDESLSGLKGMDFAQSELQVLVRESKDGPWWPVVLRSGIGYHQTTLGVPGEPRQYLGGFIGG